MPREKVKIKKIDNLLARQVTFSKRRKGLFKKARELSVLCESEVAVVVFSAKGKVFDYSSSRDVITRYNAHMSNAEKLDQQLENENRIQLSKELADKSHLLSRMNGEDLEGLEIAELEELETMVEAGLSRVLKTKEEKIKYEMMAIERKRTELIEAKKKLKQRMVMLSTKRNAPGLLEADHNLIAVNNHLGAADQNGMPSQSATDITCNSGVSQDDDGSADDLSLKLGLP